MEFPKGFPVKVLLFIGSRQNKIPVELAVSMQKMGSDARYIRIEGSGKNALDFYLTYYLGRIHAKEPLSYFHIISGDSGFDLLIKHLRNKKTLIRRSDTWNDIPFLTGKDKNDRLKHIVKFLENRGDARPRKVAKLSNAINSIFLNSLEKKELDELIQKLIRNNLMKIEGETIHYTLNSGTIALQMETTP